MNMSNSALVLKNHFNGLLDRLRDLLRVLTFRISRVRQRESL